MFGSSSPFGQSSSSPFGSQSVFGQTSNAASNPFAPKPFGSPAANPFGAQMGTSIFGGTSTGVFGQAPSPLATTPIFGASSSPAFGSSTPSFGASATPTFGSGSSPFGGSSIFGQKPAFGSTAGQPNPFGGTFQQTQSAFGSSPFGSTTPFGAPSQPAFGATSTPAFGSTATPAFGASTSAFGATSTPAFGATTTPAFGTATTPAFGATTTPTFGSTAFGSTGAAFGVSSTPAFGSSMTTTFGAGSSPVFGSSSTPAFGASTAPAFGSSTTTPFGSSSTPFSFGSAPAFGQSTAAFGSTPFGTTSFGGQSSPFGGQTATPAFGTPAFGQSALGAQRGGSRVVPYAPTVDTDGASSTQAAGKLESISAMPAYKDKSHEELRWEDYQQGDKGGPNPPGQTATGIGGFSSPTQTNPFGSTGTFGQTPASTFTSTSGSIFGQKPSIFGSSGFGASSTSSFSSPFGSAVSSPFGATSSAPLFGSSSGFGGSSTPSLFGTSATSAFGSTSLFGSSAATGSSPAFGTGLSFGNTQSTGLFSSSPATGTAPSIFGQPSTVFGQTSSAFGQSTPSFGSSLFGTQSSGFGGSLFGSSTPSLIPSATPAAFGQTTPSFSSPFQTAAPTQPSAGFSFGNIGQAQPAPSSGFGGLSSAFNPLAFGQSNAATQANVVVQPAPVTNPFGSLPAVPQMSIGRTGSASSIQYGISSIPVSEKPLQVRISSLLTPRHLSQRRIRLPPRRYHPKTDGSRVPFFTDEEEAPSTPKADALFIPRENPRALIVRPIEQWPSRTSTEKQFGSSFARENGKIDEEVSASSPTTSQADADGNGKKVERKLEHDFGREQSGPSKFTLKANGIHDDHVQKGAETMFVTMSGHRAGEAAIVYEHGADIEALMPKLRHPEYYTEPRIQELAAKERAEPGFCRHVRDFVVGRLGFGSIKFEGETDVRRLDLEALVQFNHREVIVYKDESKKPPVGQGLNKPAEVTLLNVKCIDRKTGRQYTEGPKVDSYSELLKRKAAEQGAEFVSYDPVKGEWKFKVEHFSTYGWEGNPDSSLDTILCASEGDEVTTLIL